MLAGLSDRKAWTLSYVMRPKLLPLQVKSSRTRRAEAQALRLCTEPALASEGQAWRAPSSPLPGRRPVWRPCVKARLRKDFSVGQAAWLQVAKLVAVAPTQSRWGAKEGEGARELVALAKQWGCTWTGEWTEQG